MIKELLLVLAGITCTCCSAVYAAPKKVHTINELIDRTISESPLIQAQSAQLKAADARVLQSTLLPNPQAAVELENFGGDLNGTRLSETTYTLSQPILLGGKISSRTNASNVAAKVVKMQAQQLGNKVLSQLVTSFAAVQRDKEFLSIAEQDTTIATEVLSAAKTKLKFGGVLKGEVTRAKVGLENRMIALRLASSELIVSKTQLVAFWMGNLAEFGDVPEQSWNSSEKAFDSLDIDEFPVVMLQKLQLIAAKANHALARVNRIPDLTAQAGVRQFEETDDTTFVAMLSIPIPLFNTNQGNILAAKHSIRAAEQLYRNTKINIQAQFDSLIQRRKALIPQYKQLKTVLLSESNKALKQMKEAYSAGRVGYLDLADAQRAYFDVKTQLAITIFTLNKTEAELGALSGTFMKNINGDMNNE
ncbi:Cobalt-zinc-cadmium resistance protein CzcC precursor [Bythopirellula goksoeyrii]|uniref:Cobalt-zinc-cadmium resistance protein CzcC n=2 Tax=Bythopirellula goksoeyrii TaxID=1400387 RepID=A0A5B9QA50_9BACT|nr:Cobalt-zinc-cadmium resistance protein CzcC precursor [Bythopirellula goksoeyrii]